MTGVRVTDEAVAAACAAAGWDWPTLDDDGLALPSPEEVMRPLLEAAAPLIVDDRVAAALQLHERRQTTPSTGAYCALDSEDWPCATARALGAGS